MFRVLPLNVNSSSPPSHHHFSSTAFRFQCAGWRSLEEYSSEYDELQTWPATEYGQFIKMLRVKKNGNFMYFRQTRECEDKHLNKVKIYEY